MGGVAEQLVELKLYPQGVQFQCCTTVDTETTTNNEQTRLIVTNVSNFKPGLNFAAFILERKEKHLSLEIYPVINFLNV